MHSFPTVACRACGAPLRVDPLADTATCSHCEVTSAVSDALRVRAAAYVAQIRKAWADALETQRAALLHRQAAEMTPRFWRWFLLFALSAPAAIALPALSSRLPWEVTVLMVGALGVVWYRFMATFLGMFREPSIGMMLAAGLGECRSCGAPVTLPEGEVRTTCEHCGATVIATVEVKRALVGAAFERVRTEARAHDVAFAAHHEVAYEATAAYGVRAPISTVATVVLVLGAFALTGAIVFVMGRPAGPEAPWVCPALGLAALAMAGWFAIAVRRVRRDALAFQALTGRTAGSPAMRKR